MMPVSQPAAGGFLRKLGDKLKKVHEEVKNEETEFSGFGDIPPGVNGVAQLTECKLGVFENGDNKGEYFFYAHGTILAPKEFKNPDTGLMEKVEGRLTKIGPEALCETPNAKGKRKTFRDHLSWVYNELRKLGVNTANLKVEHLEQTVNALKQPANAPTFRFRTWRGKKSDEYPDPRVNHDWEGATEYVPAEGDGQQVDDQTPADEAPPPPPAARPAARPGAAQRTPAAPVNGAARPAAPARQPAPATRTAAQPPAKPPAKKAPPAPAPEPEPFNEFGDLDSLLERANADDAEAQNELCDLAQKQGWDKHATDTATDWNAVYEMAKAGPGDAAAEEPAEEGGDPAEEATGWTGDPPAKADVYLYRQINPKTKRPVDTASEYEVVAVDLKKRTVSLKSLENPKAAAVPNVSWDDLSAATTE